MFLSLLRVVLDPPKEAHSPLQD